MGIGEIKNEHAELAQVLAILANAHGHRLIITSRYPLPGEAFEQITTLNLNHVGLNDFWKKCHNLELKFIAEYFGDKKREGIQLENEKVNFEDIVRYLHQSFGGNYRALELFSKKINADKGNIGQTLDSLDAFRKKYKDAKLEVMQEMSQDLFFKQLTDLLKPEQAETLQRLSQFNIPVTFTALDMQDKKAEKNALQSRVDYLQQLTLVEKLQPGPDLPVYLYVSPLVKGLLEDNPMQNTNKDFSHSEAGHYHLYAFHNLGFGLSDWEEAFNHFMKAKDKAQVGKLGLDISNFYYDNSLYQKAFIFAKAGFNLLQQETPPYLLNKLGLIFDLAGKYDHALEVYKMAHEKFRHTGDKAGEGTTLNNISQIYDARGDYQQALSYLEQSLKIQREIGDKAGMIPTLHNMASIAIKQQDNGKYFKYHSEAWQLAMETKNAMGIFNVGRSYGEEVIKAGYKKEGLEILKTAFAVGQQSGLPGTEEIGKLIQQFENS